MQRRDKRHILIVEIKQKCVRFVIACEIKQQQIQCDIKLKLLAAVKWEAVLRQASGAAASGAAAAFGWISIFRLCITFAYELKRVITKSPF